MTKSRQPMDENASKSPFGISISLSPFNLEIPNHWFTQLEGFFFLQYVDVPLAQYYAAIIQLPREVTREIFRAFSRPHRRATLMASSMKLNYLECEKLDKVKVRELLIGIQTGDRTPLQLSPHMKSLAGSLQHHEDIFRELWQRRLPSDVQTFPAIHLDRMELGKHAVIADTIYECLQRQCMTQISASSMCTDR